MQYARMYCKLHVRVLNVDMKVCLRKENCYSTCVSSPRYVEIEYYSSTVKNEFMMLCIQGCGVSPLPHAQVVPSTMHVPTIFVDIMQVTHCG